MKVISTKISEETYLRLKDYVLANYTTINSVLSQVITEHLAKEPANQGQLSVKGADAVMADLRDDCRLGNGERARRFIAAYVEAYKKRYKCNPGDILDPKTIGQIVNFLKVCPLEKACQLIQVYLQMDNQWFETKGHDFMTFRTNLNKVNQASETGKESGGIDWDKVFKKGEEDERGILPGSNKQAQ